jgi:hypothetical protein
LKKREPKNFAFMFVKWDRYSRRGKVPTMFWSSTLPVALPISVLSGILFFVGFHDLGFDIPTSIIAAKICAGLVNLAIGVPKNALSADILSLVFIRPLSLLAAVALVGHAAGVLTTPLA